MPLYDFECGVCGARFEETIPVGATPPVCPTCASSDTRRIFSSFALWRTNKTPGQRRRNEAQRSAVKERKREEFAREQQARQRRER